MKTHLYVAACLLLTACADSVVEVDPVRPTVEGSWQGSFVNVNYMRGGTPRTEWFEIEFIQRSDNTVEGAGMTELTYGDEFEKRSYLSFKGVFVEPNLSVNGSSFWEVVMLRGQLDGDVLHLTKNGVHEVRLYRQ
jgi:hypothetical protein